MLTAGTGRPSKGPRPLIGVLERVGQRKRDVSPPVTNQFQIIDGRGRHFSGGPDRRELLVQDLGDAAAVRVIDAARAAGRDRKKTC